MRIQFCGASTGVTGSCHLITTEHHKILLDCGQFQGGKAMDAMNYEPFPFDPAEIDYMVLSHAHIDHCGRIPLLIKRGFKGDIYCTDATADLLEVMLKDSGYIHEKEAEWKNRKNERAGRPLVEPLYTCNDAVESLKFVKPVLYDQLIELNPEMKIVFNDAGHILGSAITELWVTEGESVSKIVFSGDLGVMDRPILRDPTIIKKADYVIMETTYGNRLHPQNSMDVKSLMEIVIKTARRGGTVVIPSFAVGRTQELIYEFNRFYDEMKEIITNGDNPLDFKNLRFTRSTEDSIALNHNDRPKVIISASGMCEAGRIRHHLKHNLWNPKASVIFVGYQAEGTLGRLLVEGAKEVTLFGEEIQVNAEIYNLEGFSGHADRDGLLMWLGGFQKEPKHIFLVHGEPEAKEDFAQTVEQKLGYHPIVVQGNSEFVLEKDEILNKREAMQEAMDSEALESVKKNIADIHRRLEGILYNTHLAVDSKLSPEKLAKINNIVLELEKDSVNLGAAVTEENR